jgi:hypothetical protein
VQEVLADADHDESIIIELLELKEEAQVSMLPCSLIFVAQEKLTVPDSSKGQGNRQRWRHFFYSICQD